MELGALIFHTKTKTKRKAEISQKSSKMKKNTKRKTLSWKKVLKKHHFFPSAVAISRGCKILKKKRKEENRMRIIDLTRRSMGWNNPFQTRRVNQIRNIGIHHSATTSGGQFVFENHWRTRGWRNGGYSEIILPNGDVEICYEPTVVTNGAHGVNPETYHICVVGNFRTNGSQPSAIQMRSLFERIRFNMSRFVIPVERVLGHNEFPNNATICPGMTMNSVRSKLRTPSVAVSPNVATHTVRAGETLSQIAQRHRTTVSELQRLNNIQNVNIIRVGQVLRLPTGTIASTPTSNTIRVGSRVRVNAGARTWSTGQAIPSWVRTQVYTVGQMRNNNNELLLNGILSWIRRSDVTLV